MLTVTVMTANLHTRVKSFTYSSCTCVCVSHKLGCRLKWADRRRDAVSDHLLCFFYDSSPNTTFFTYLIEPPPHRHRHTLLNIPPIIPSSSLFSSALFFILSFSFPDKHMITYIHWICIVRLMCQPWRLFLFIAVMPERQSYRKWVKILIRPREVMSLILKNKNW